MEDTIRPKWQYKNNIWCSIYNRHPDTGSNKYQGAYAYPACHTEQELVKMFESHGWTFLRKDRHLLVFLKPGVTNEV